MFSIKEEKLPTYKGLFLITTCQCLKMKIYILPNRSNLKDNGYTQKEEGAIYDEQLEELFNNPRWYLDNLESMREYCVSWKDFNSKTPTIPLKFVKK